MWWAGASRRGVHDVYLELAEVGWRRPDGTQEWLRHSDVVIAAQDVFARLRASAPARWRKPKVRVWLGGALARPFLFGPVAGLRRWAEVEGAARAMASDATGLEGECVVRVVAWPMPGATLVATLPASLQSALHDAAKAQRVRVCSVMPWWWRAWQARSAADGAHLLGLLDGDAVTVLGGRGSVVALASTSVPPPAQEAVDPLLARLRAGASLGDAAPAHVSLQEALPEEGAGSPDRFGPSAAIDFALPRRMPRIGWALPGAVVVGAAMFMGLAVQLSSARHSMDAKAARLMAEAAAPRSPAPAASRPPYHQSAEEMRTAHGFPWPEVLTALESAPGEGIVVTGVELNGRERSARLEIEFSDHAKLATYIDALNAGGPNALQWTLHQAQQKSAAAMTATLAVRFPDR